MKILTLIFLLLPFTSIFSQAWIDSIQIKSTTLSTTDTLKLISFVKTKAAGCGLQNSEIDINDFVINITNCYWYGNADSICPSVDTLFINNLGIGNYELKFKIRAKNEFPTECLNVIDMDSFTTNIVVENTNSIENNIIEEYRIHLIENPVSELLRIKIIVKNSGNYFLRIFNSLGTEILSEEYYFPESNEMFVDLNVENLPVGIYFYSVGKNQRIFKTQKFIKN